MAEAVFPDNTVLCNFAAVDRLDLLSDWLRGRGRWTEAVAAEAFKSAGHLPALATVHADGWLGEPIVIDGADDVEQVDRVRRVVFGGIAARPMQHLGEAQTLWLIQTSGIFLGSWWISDDLDALEFARRQHVIARDTCDVMRILVADGDLSSRQAFDHLADMVEAGRRGVRLPGRAADLNR